MKSSELHIGFSTGVFFAREVSLIQTLRELHSVSPELVELNLATIKELDALSTDEITLCQTFSRITIHAPFKGVRYGVESASLLERLRSLSEQLGAQYIVFHPDIIDDFSLIERIIGSLAAIENMDWRKSAGGSVEDMKRFFTQCPSARWLCDLNHVYTLDRSMQLSRELYESFGSRLAGYHVSGFGGEREPHVSLSSDNGERILQSLEEKAVPVINEGVIDDLDRLKLEYVLMRKYFESLSDDANG